MKVKIWGARGSIPAPLRPEVIREKIVSALLGIAEIEDDKLRNDIVATILENPERRSDVHAQSPSTGLYSQVNQKIQAKRRRAVEDYVDSLSPLAGSTASGNTPCIEIRTADNLFIIDAGSGIRDLGLKLMAGPCGRGEGVIHLLFSHPHWDHIQGFPFFRPAFVPGNKIYIYSIHDMETALRRQQEFISFPISLDYMQADMIFTRIEPGQVLTFNDLRIRNIRNDHPGDAYGYRFEKGNKVFVYASDSAYPDGADLLPHLNFFNEADVVIFDAQFTQRESDEKEDWGHSSSFVGLEMAQEANVKNLVLFHYDPTYSDQDLEKILLDTLKFQQNQYPNKTPVKVMIAKEGQSFDLTAPQTTEVQQLPGSHAAILKPSGIFDEHVAIELKEQLAEAAQTEVATKLIIDMSAVKMLQVAGLRALVKLRQDRQDEGASMALVGLSDNVHQLIDLAGYLDYFAIYPSVRVALEALQTRETQNLPGQTLKNRYKIETKIGEGQLGTVFKATDLKQNSLVAIKVLSASFSEGAIEQFLRQARQIIDLVHPNIVGVYDCDEERDIPFMVEEFIDSRNLQDLIDDKPGQPLPFDIALSLTGSITRALEYAHAKGVIHGDLKPKNVMLTNEVKISDFGLGRLETGKALINIDVPLTLVSARYLAPEQVLGHPIDARTDLYALGVILYELFTGHPPFDGAEREILEQHRSQPPKSPRALNPSLSRSLEHLILKLLDKDPTKRYASARQVGYILSSMSGAISHEVQSRIFPIERWPALVGRKESLQHLSRLWLKTAQGQGQIVFIHGQAGIGKTRLIDELINRLDTATVLIGECQRLEKSAAYHPFISALNTYFDVVPPEIAAESVGQVWQAMTQIVPEIAAMIPTAPKEITKNEPDPITALSLGQAIGRVSAHRPWLLVLDNLHWADQSSLNLLDYLARACAAMPVMLVGIYDSDKVPADAPLSSLQKKLSDRSNYTDFLSKPLTEAEVQKLLESIWSQSVPAELITTVYKLTKGNPLHIEEVAQGLIEEGIVIRRDHKWYFEGAAKAQLPAEINRAIIRRVRRLSRETQTFLNQIAILDPVTHFDELHEMSDLSQWDALENLDIALQRRLVKELPGDKVMRFSHAKIQETLYKGLSSLKRRLLHREAGEALERQYINEPKNIVEALANHFLQAGELEKGLIYSVQAAIQADSIYAQQNSLHWYTQALDIMDQLSISGVTQKQRFELLLARERLYGHQGSHQAQLSDLETLQSLAEGLNDPTKQAQAHNRQAIFEFTMGRLTEARTEAQTGLIAARQADNPTLAAHNLVQLAHIALHQGQIDTARKHLDTAQSTLHRTRDRQAEARTLNGLGTFHKSINDYAKSESYYHKALITSKQAGDWHGQAICLSNWADLLLKKGDYIQAKSQQEQALVINQFTGNRQREAICLRRLAAVYRDLGCYDTAKAYAEKARSLHHSMENEQGMAADLHMLGTIYCGLGAYKAARDHAGQALQIFQHGKNKLYESMIWLEIALALEGFGEQAKASHAFDQAQLIHAEIGSETGAFDAKAGLARCWLAEGKIANAQQQVNLFLQASNQNGLVGVSYPIRLYLTAYQVLQAAKNPEAALRALHLGHDLLQSRAENIDDPQLKLSFLQNVPANKALLDQLEENKVTEARS